MKQQNERTGPSVAKASAPPTRSDSMASEPSEADIRMRAYWRFLERGAGHGMDFDDWLQAERELMGKPKGSRLRQV